MNMKDISRNMDELREILASWDGDGVVPELERDMALEKLRAVYDGIKFPQAAREPIPDSILAQLEALFEAEKEHVAELQHVAKGQPETVVEAGYEEPEPEVEPVPVAQETAPETAQQELPVNPRQKVDKDVIRSLYGEDMRISAKSITVQKPVMVEAPEEEEPSIFSEPSNEEHVVPAAAPVAEDGNGGQKKVLGETISQQGVAINEKLARTNGNGGDIADKLYSRSIVSIKQSIGVNDRFTIVRELFGGDTDKFNEAVARLDEFTDFDEAMIYISLNYSWNPDSPAVMQIVDLLDRKLGM